MDGFKKLREHPDIIKNVVYDKGTIFKHDIKLYSINSHSYFIGSEGIDEDCVQKLRRYLNSIDNEPKQCFYNSMKLHSLDSDFKYCEGVIKIPAIANIYIDHAWNVYQNKLIDITTPVKDKNETDDGYFNIKYYGVIFNSDTTDEYYKLCGRHKSYGIIGNHIDQHKYLRENGYLD